MFALAIYTDRHEGEVAFHAPSGCIVNFEPQAVAARRARHTAEGGSLAGREGRICIQWNLKGDSSRGGAEEEEERKTFVSLMKTSVHLRNVG